MPVLAAIFVLVIGAAPTFTMLALGAAPFAVRLVPSGRAAKAKLLLRLHSP